MPYAADDALPITVQTQDGAAHTSPTEAQLRAMIGRIGGEHDHFLILERIPNEPEVYAQTWRDESEPYDVEYRQGSADQHFRTELTDQEQVAAVLLGWVWREPDWRGDHDWLPLGQTIPQLPAETSTAVAEYASEQLDTGFYGYREIVEHLVEYFAGSASPVSLDQAQQILEPLWVQREAEQADWPASTEADRLLAVFDVLNEAGITARANFADCNSCGLAEIAGVAKEDDRGFVFFHYQDTEHLAHGQGLMLSFGSLPGRSLDTLSVGREVAAALTAAGFPVVWPESADKRIRVTPLNWQKRLPAQ